MCEKNILKNFVNFNTLKKKYIYMLSFYFYITYYTYQIKEIDKALKVKINFEISQATKSQTHMVVR